MKAIKRTVAALLATLMLATSTSFTLAAETYTDKEAVVVAKVNAAGIMTGTDKGFEPSKTLTRAEAAAIIVRMKGISESAVKTMAGTTLFKDVAASHWASGYVNQASNLGIVKGVSATEFAPDREVTVAEFVTMAIRALGAGQLVDAEGTWPANYVNFANENDILKDVSAIYTATATRLNAATIVANTLETPIWEKTGVKSNGEITWGKTSDPEKTIIKDVLKYGYMFDKFVHSVDFINNKVTLVDIDDLDDYWTARTAYEADTSDDTKKAAMLAKTSTYKVVKTFDLTSLKVGSYYDGYYDNDEREILGLWVAEDAKVETVAFDEIKKIGSDYIKVIIDGEEVEYDLVASPNFFENGKLVAANSISNLDLHFGAIQLQKGDAWQIYTEIYTFAGVVDEVTSTRVKFDNLDKNAYADPVSAFKIDEDKYTYFVTKNGKSIDITDVQEDDVLFFYIDENDADVYHVLVLTDSVEGKVTATGTNYIKLDGKKYTTASSAVTATAGDEIEIFLNEAGKVAAYRTIEGSSDWAVVSSLEFVRNDKDKVKVNVTLTYTDGTKSDKLNLDLADSDSCLANDIKSVFNSTTAAGISTADEDKLTVLNGLVDNTTAANLKKSLLGKIVSYEIDGSDVIIKDVEWLTAQTTPTIITTDIVDEDTYDFKAGSSKQYFTKTGSTVYVTNSTKILLVKKDTEDAYKVKVSPVDLDSLESETGLTVAFADVDSETGKAKVAVINEVAKKAKKGTTQGNWAIVTEVSNKLDKDADYDREVTVITADNKEITYYADEDILPATPSDAVLAKFGEITLNDEEITDFEPTDYHYYDNTLGTPTLNGKAIYSDEDDIIYLCKDTTTAAESFVLSDKIIYIELTEEGYEVAEARDLDYATKVDTAEFDLDDASNIIAIYTYEFEDGAEEVIAIVFDNLPVAP